MRRAVALLALLAAIGAAVVPRAEAAAEWRSQQPLGPEGRTPLGEVGDIECYQVNRCVLITAGNGGMPAGIYAYDGSENWHLYSTVCGGHQGRIAWAGPTEFWTISDQQAGQGTGNGPPRQVSLCHFKDGAVVASYAEPIGVPTSYLPMNAAACLGPDECWFAGERLPGTVNVGAFHLYWNGISLTAAPSLTEPQPELEDPGRAVVSLAFHEGALYEGVRAQEGDVAPAEPASEPSFLHRVLPGTLPAFQPLFPAAPLVYGAGATPRQLEGFRLSGDGEDLWAVSGANQAPAEVTVLHLGAGGFEQVALDDPAGAFSPGDRVTGVAAELGAEAAWVGFRHGNDPLGTAPARLALVHADGHVDPPLSLPLEGEGIGHKGRGGPIVCPAAGQCWTATETGWLFHLGPDPAQDTAPAMHTLITFRPPDGSLPSVPSVSLPEDDSGAGQLEGQEEPVLEAELGPEPLPRALVSKVHSRLIGKDVLELSFVLRAKASVRLVARRAGKVVAATKRHVLAKGRRSLRLRLDPERWPTKLDLQVHAVKGAAK